MRIIEDEIIIDDPYIVGFLSKYGSPEFLYSCEELIKNVCKLCEKNNGNGNNLDNIMMHLNIFKNDLTKDITNEVIKQDRNIDLSQVSNHINELKERINLSNMVDQGIKTRDDSILSSIVHNQKTLENIGNKLEELKISRNSNRFKGESAENDLKDLLEQTFQLRDYYEIIETKNVPNSCDFIIRHTGYNDISVECKNYSYDVGTSEVKKFESDILGLNNHGIFISMNTKICGKGLIEINLLHNNKFAIYLSNNNFDRDIIKDMVNLIYKLDTFSSDNNFKITQESIVSIKNYITDYTIKVKSIKTHLKSSLELLGNLDFSYIEKLINGGNIGNANIDISDIKCQYCEKNFKKINGLTSHLKICKKKTNNILNDQ